MSLSLTLLRWPLEGVFTLEIIEKWKEGWHWWLGAFHSDDFILFLYPVLNSPTNSCCIHLAKPTCFKSTKMNREKQVLLCIFGRGQPHFISLNVADVAILGWPICGLYLWILLWEREYRVQDRHGKGIRQMCCCVWVDQAPGFYCCFSREPLGSLNLPVKFWESQRKSATFLRHLAISTLLQAFH